MINRPTGNSLDMRLIVLLVSVCWIGSSAAETIYVDGTNGDDTWDGRCAEWDGGECGPRRSIQWGIYAASDGDTVIVADGTYTGVRNRGLDTGGLRITLRSVNGPDFCIIDCEEKDRGFKFRFGETSDTVVDGFTVTRGRGEDANFDGGGGIVCYHQSSPTIVNCNLTNNYARFGGGIYIDTGSGPIISDCSIVANNADSYGGGVYAEPSQKLTRCTIAENSASTGGGVYGRSFGMFDCRVERNSLTSAYGGTGAGVYAESVSLFNCVVAGNSAAGRYSDGRGGGVFVYKGATIKNCTFTGNYAEVGGALALSGSQSRIDNSVFWENIAIDGPEVELSSGAKLTVSYSLIAGGWAWIVVPEGCDLDWLTGNLVDEPQLADPDGPDDDSTTWRDNDYRPTNASPIIDAADNSVVPNDGYDIDNDGDTVEKWPLDLDGNPRFVDDPNTEDSGYGTPPIVDMGAYEFQGGGSPIRGDTNCDAQVNFNDIDPFVLALLGEDGYRSQYPDCRWNAADCNGDGFVDFNDIDPFVGCLLDGGCP